MGASSAGRGLGVRMIPSVSSVPSIRVLAGAAIFAAVLGGIGQGCSDAASTACHNVPNEQQGSFMARVEEVPLKVVIDPNFTVSEQQAIAGAIDEWNAYGRQVRGQGYFVLQNSTEIPQKVRDANPRECGQAFGMERQFYILKEDSATHWKSIGFDETIPGATLRCVSGDMVAQQIIYIKPDIVASAQVGSVAVHELGHSIGLDHSCTTESGRADYIACGKVGQNHPYRSAVMYPSIRTRSHLGDASASREVPEVRNILGDNDKLRASCLYPSP